MPESVKHAGVTLGPQGTGTPPGSPTVDLRQALAAAIEAPLEKPIDAPTVCMPYPQSLLKTSETHPIKCANPVFFMLYRSTPSSISMLIPPELLLVLSSHLIPTPAYGSAPTIFEVPLHYTLDRLTSNPGPIPFSTCERPIASRGIRRPMGPTLAFPVPSTLKHGPGRLSPLSPRTFNRMSPPPVPTLNIPTIKSSEELTEILLTDARTQTSPKELLLSPPSRDDLHTPAPVSDALPTISRSRPSTPRVTLGNLFLSSCPGKKGASPLTPCCAAGLMLCMVPQCASTALSADARASAGTSEPIWRASGPSASAASSAASTTTSSRSSAPPGRSTAESRARSGSTSSGKCSPPPCRRPART